MKRFWVVLAAWLLVAAGVLAQERAYSEGPVVEVTSVRIKDGQFDNYMHYLQGRYKPLLEAQKKAGIVLDYGVYSVSPRTPSDPNLYLVVVYPNMAMLDGLEDKMEPLERQVTGQTRAQSAKAYADRGSMREILGSELLRELRLK
ncbi:hypothetical protein [Vulcaniibacterium gelatinicum]|uniref:hypothetical protein n=1 Tax=Vulcaniibacterium gelatinicum TaxID=2598725 RepID=UPI0011C804E1|nr:hypothetical protein [Vulcaniibacterium gelatinicum]